MKISKDVQADARRLLRLCQEADGSLDTERVRLVAASIEAKRPRNALALLTAFTALVRLQQHQFSATIRSAVALDEEQKSLIMQKLSARYSSLQYKWEVEPALIAGLSVQVGDEVMDATVSSRIARLAQI